MKKIAVFLPCAFALMLSACDLQPKIKSIPDSVGEFISARYPTLLANPDTEPEIYNSAATDYGVYASPELYGSSNAIDDYVLYASVDDYIVPPQPVDEPVAAAAPQSGAENTAPAQPITAENNEITSNADVQTAANEYLVVPMYGGVFPDAPADATQTTVARGDTLYSIARRNNTTVNELAKINNLSEPYALRVGQTLKLKPDSAPVNVVAPEPVKVVEKPVEKPIVKPDAAPAQNTTTRVALQEITVARGDTLYSLSRAYAVPVNDLAVMNNLTAPFALTVGQKLKVPNLSDAPVMVATTPAPVVAKSEAPQVANTTAKITTNAAPARAAATAKATQTVAQTTAQTTAKTASAVTKAVAPAKTTTTTKKATETKAAAKTAAQSSQPATTKNTTAPKVQSPKTQTQKISSDPKKKLPAIQARSSSKFSWPVRGKILSQYGAKSGGLFNDGINISAARGTPVKAAENGVVAYAGNEVKGMGNLIIVQHTGGWMTVYAHMDSLAVRRGAKVSVGQKIGTVGATGKVEQPQLHFEIRKGTKAYNPSSYLKK